MNKHTPGPWIWEEGQPNIKKYWNGANHQVAAVDYKKLAWHEDSNCAGRESGANARLIAAAPDLLALHKKHMELMMEIAQELKNPRLPLETTVSASIRMLAAAAKESLESIAKATGETA